MPMAQLPGKRMIPVHIDESIYREIKVYCAETDQYFQDTIKAEVAEFEQNLLKLVTIIKDMKRKAEQERLRQEEVQRISTENPMPVIGHEVEPIPAQ